jgi:predicted phosphoribosyltransferase
VAARAEFPGLAAIQPVMMFDDRIDAARQLARRLERYKGAHPLVLAIPRGGVPMGRVIADALGGDLDVVLVRKLGSPFNPEFGIGAIDESGNFHLTADAPYAGATPDYIQREKAAQLARIRERRERWSKLRPPVDPRGRVVIVVDDGLATGVTMAAALRFLRDRGSERLVCAVPVASVAGVEAVKRYADEVVTLETPEPFRAVSLFYRNFSQVEDDEVAELLAA